MSSTTPIKFFKELSTLPQTLEANAFYAVRVGVGFDLYLTNGLGQIAHKINSSSTLNDLTDVDTTNSVINDILVNTQEGLWESKPYLGDMSEFLSYVFASPDPLTSSPYIWNKVNSDEAGTIKYYGYQSAGAPANHIVRFDSLTGVLTQYETQDPISNVWGNRTTLVYAALPTYLSVLTTYVTFDGYTNLVDAIKAAFSDILQVEQDLLQLNTNLGDVTHDFYNDYIVARDGGLIQ